MSIYNIIFYIVKLLKRISLYLQSTTQFYHHFIYIQNIGMDIFERVLGWHGGIIFST